MKLKIKTLLIFTLGFLMISANAGIIVPKKGKIEFGDVVVIKGKIKYRNNKLAYYSTNKKVTNYFKAAMCAYKDKNPKMSIKLMKISIQKEKKTSKAAKRRLKIISEEYDDRKWNRDGITGTPAHIRETEEAEADDAGEADVDQDFGSFD